METPSKGVGKICARLSIEYKPVESLTPNPNNPRIHTNKQIQQIARSIEAFGFVFPVVIRPSGQVVAGHGRVQAARLLHLSEIPTVALQHLEESQLTALMLADNRLCEQSEWDPRLLGEQLKALSKVELNFSLEATGFEMGEIDLLIENLQPGAENDWVADALPEAEPGVRVTVPGDLWLLGNNRVLCCDPLDPSSYSKIMEGRKAAMVFTEPPDQVPISELAAGLGAVHHENSEIAVGGMSEAKFTDFLTRIFNLLISQTVEGSIHFVFADRRHISQVLIAGKQVYGELTDLCVWAKTNANAEKGPFYRNQHELVFVFKNGKDLCRNDFQPGEVSHHRSNVWRYPRSKPRSRAKGGGNLALRPTEKPVPLVADAVMDCSAKGDIVLDPFLGSGTTVIAAERTSRICHGIEIDPTSVDTIIRRWQTFTGLSAKHAISGRSFREREQEVGSGLNQ